MMASLFRWKDGDTGADGVGDAGLTIGAWIPLVPSTAAAGALQYVPASHMQGRVGYNNDQHGKKGLRVTPGAFNALWQDKDAWREMEEAAAELGMADWSVTLTDGGVNAFVAPAGKRGMQPGDVVLHRARVRGQRRLRGRARSGGDPVLPRWNGARPPADAEDALRARQQLGDTLGRRRRSGRGGRWRGGAARLLRSRPEGTLDAGLRGAPARRAG